MGFEKAPLIHRVATHLAGGRNTVPVLVAEGQVYPDSTDIIEYIHMEHNGGWRPYFDDPTFSAEARRLEELFDTRLGPHSRRLAYSHLLDDDRLSFGAMMPGVGDFERVAFRMLAPVIKKLMRVGMRIDDEGSVRSLGVIREVFAAVDEMLSEGRRYLVGDGFSAADLTFAALSAPILLPRNYGSPLPSLDEVPTAMLKHIEEFRSLPAGAFALRIYRDHR
ncbi:MAG: glutathione S-transferase N-terminal domain-containing protein [Acidobacteriota bacterium]